MRRAPASGKASAGRIGFTFWGDKQSIYEVGRCMFYGIGTKRDRRLADAWLARAEALGVS